MRRKVRAVNLCMVSAMVIAIIVMSCASSATTPTPTTSSPTKTSATPTTTAPAPTTAPATTPAPQKPQYGGTLNLVLNTDITTFDTWDTASGSQILGVVQQPLWAGDWTKGNAGGYGTKQTDWGPGVNDFYENKTGFLSDSIKWTVDAASNQATIVIQVRQGIHYALDTNSEASKLVNGREMTADDVLFNLQRTLAKGSYLSKANPELMTAVITKTGPSEITIKVPVAALAPALTRWGGQTYIEPPEVIQKYGNMKLWQNVVGTGAFELNDYVSGSAITLNKNPNYWMKDPIGPGKGNQLPYLDGEKVLIIPDNSTVYTAMKTGKIDFLNGSSTGPLSQEDADQMTKTNPKILQSSAPSYQGRGTPMFMRTDKAPFNDIKVRQAMMMAVDFNSILNNLYKGKGQIVTWPYAYSPDYAGLYLGLNDPEMPQAVKDLYTYNPTKAKQLLADAGYPTGFKTEIMITSAEGDYYSMIKNMFAVVGIDMSLNVVDPVAKNSIQLARTVPALTTGTTGPVNNFITSTSLTGTSQYNDSMLNDPIINDALTKIQLEYPQNSALAMKDFKDMSKYVDAQAYVIPNVIGDAYTLWQPWLKNYSGEWTMGGNIPMWPQFIWYDSVMKKSLGY